MATNLQLAAEAELELRKRKTERIKNSEQQKIYYRQNPVDYFVERLGFTRESLDWLLLPQYQKHKWDGTVNPLKKVLDLLSAGTRRIGVESATGTGKTKLGAGIVLWFLECYENSLVVTTAPKQDQLLLHIWKEIGKMYNNFGQGSLTTLKLRMIEDSNAWAAVGFVAGVRADEESATKAQGFHAEHMLIILEETPGIPPPIITAFQNTAGAPHNIILALGNPDHQLDTLHRFCSLANVTHIRISGFDHPNVVINDSSFVPGAVSKEGLEDMLARYGSADNPLYLSRARGISPGQSSDSLIKLQWCVDAIDEKNRDRNALLNGERGLGVDVANSESGDKAAIAYGQGAVLLEVNDFHCPDSNQLGKRDIYTKMKEEDISPEHVGVDGIGVGAGTVNALKEMDIKVISLIGSDAAVKQKGEEDFNNLRSQMWWQIREDLRHNEIILPNDNELISDLTTPKWSIKNGRIVIESKEDIKSRHGRSPNKGDAAVYWNWVRIKRGKSKEINATIV